MQTKDEKKAAKRARLDPDSILNRSAKDELDARASSKRNRRQVEEEDAAVDDAESQSSDISDLAGVERETPRERTEPAQEEPRKKKQKIRAQDGQASSGKTEKQLMREAKKQAKKEAKKAKTAEKQKRRQDKAAAKAASVPSAEVRAKAAQGDMPQLEDAAQKSTKDKKKSKLGAKRQSESTADVPAVSETNATADSKETSEPKYKPTVKPQAKTDAKSPFNTARNLVDAVSHDEPVQDAGPSNASSSSESMSPTFDAAELSHQTTNSNSASTTTSVASVPTSNKPKQIKLPVDTTEARERLRAKLEAMRAARKAPGTGDRPVRSRKELMEQRRQKEAERKDRKKELRHQAKLEEEQKREEALAANSPLAMSPPAEVDETTLSFGRVAFNDNTQLSHDLSYVLSRDKKKGPSDPKTALLKLQNQKKRLDNMDSEKRQDVEDKEAWLTARRRAEGEKVRDDESLLKKAVKRKERQKSKSEKAWEERSQGVHKAQAAKQKKREENLQKRKDEKLGRKLKLGKKGGKAKGGRPGFEGSLGGGKRKAVRK